HLRFVYNKPGEDCRPGFRRAVIRNSLSLLFLSHTLNVLQGRCHVESIRIFDQSNFFWRVPVAGSQEQMAAPLFRFPWCSSPFAFWAAKVRRLNEASNLPIGFLIGGTGETAAEIYCVLQLIAHQDIPLTADGPPSAHTRDPTSHPWWRPLMR